MNNPAGTARPSAPKLRPRVTINDLAEALGLTKGTVSRALNGYPDISPSTQTRVRHQAEKMGYRPLSHAQAIRTGRARSLGLVLQDDEAGTHRPFLAEFVAGITHAASAENWTLTIATARTEAGVLDTMERLIDERKADGFIVPRTLRHDPRVELLRKLEKPFVLFGRVENMDGCAWYDISGEDAMHDAVLRLAGFGHKRIAYVGGGDRHNFTGLRRQGYLDGMAEAGLEVDPLLIREGGMTAIDGRQAAMHLLRMPQPPTGIVFAVDRVALGGYRAAARLGLTVGRDISIISYDGVPEGAYATPALTSFAVDSRRAGERLAQLLLALVRGADPETLRVLEPARLVAGGSDGPPAMDPRALAARVALTSTNPSK
ncbi:LacI family DNA-binding transcriptional regulator [Halovulum sp. GXIMD14794]